MTLDARVDRLEQHQQTDGQQIRAGLNAQAYGLSLVHADTGALRTDVTEIKDRLDGIDGRLGGMDGRLEEIGAILGELVRRLPPAPRQAGD